MKELHDYSGPLISDFKYVNFTKEFLIRLLREYTADFFKMADISQTLVREKWGSEKAAEFQFEQWSRMFVYVRPRIARLAGITLPVKDLYEALKVLQLVPDSVSEGMHKSTVDFKSPYHLVMNITLCAISEAYRAKAPEKLASFCSSCLKTSQADVQTLNPKIKLRALRMPPHDFRDGIVCQWEMMLE